MHQPLGWAREMVRLTKKQFVEVYSRQNEKQRQ